MRPFTISAAPELHFGAGTIESLHLLIRYRGWRVILLVISRSALSHIETRTRLLSGLESSGISHRAYRYDRVPDGLDPFTAPRGPHREPTPIVVDAITKLERSSLLGTDGWAPADAVVAIGGGSALDTGKALSAALMHTHPISHYLEGVGTEEPTGEKLPFIAVPTTAGTGSEATKNAVLSEVGENGFKKSLRHDRFTPDLAIVDPLLQMRCSPSVTAASGMDAIAQLLEAYLSTSATPLTDALALDGLSAAGRCFVHAVKRGESDVDARAGMAYAAYLSGVCLANAGLGVIHGLAGPAGAHSAAPHGAFCGALLRSAIEMLAERLDRQQEPEETLGRLASAGRALLGRGVPTTKAAVQMLLDRLAEFTRVGELPGLKFYGFTNSLVRQVAREGSSKLFPVAFDESDRVELLERCL